MKRQTRKSCPKTACLPELQFASKSDFFFKSVTLTSSHSCGSG